MGPASGWSGGRTGQNSPRLYALLALLLRRWPANAGKNCPAILAVSRRKGRLDAMGFHNPPSMALPCCPPFAQGGLRRAAAGKTLFAWMDTTGLARERSMGAASRRQSLSRRLPTAPFAQGSHLCLGEHNRHGYSAALGPGGDPAWGAKKVGEKPSFSPRASGGVGYRLASYFGFTPK